MKHSFPKGRSCTDCIITLTQKVNKRREFDLPTYTVSIAYEKLFGKINRNIL